ncbi:MAG: RNase H family protein [Actinomycetales bacterium]
MTIVAATDGSALGNPGPAGWAWYIDENRWDAGGWRRATNNMGELTAILQVLCQTAEAGQDLLILSDSQYAINSITKWMPGWKKKGWKKRDGKPPENLDIMKALDAAMLGRRVRFEWVKGHAGHDLNERADRLANEAATSWQRGIEPAPGPGFSGSDSRPTKTPPATSTPPPTRTPAPASEPEDLFSTLDLSEPPASTPADRVETLQRALLDGDEGTAAELIDTEWIGIGATGELTMRADLLAHGSVPSATYRLERVRHLAPDLVQVIFRADDRTHSTLWIDRDGRWRQIFAQSTPGPSH